MLLQAEELIAKQPGSAAARIHSALGIPLVTWGSSSNRTLRAVEGDRVLVNYSAQLDG